MKRIRVPAIELPVHITAVLKYSFLLIRFNIKGLIHINKAIRNHHLDIGILLFALVSSVSIFKICLLGKNQSFFLFTSFNLPLNLQISL